MPGGPPARNSQSPGPHARRLPARRRPALLLLAFLFALHCRSRPRLLKEGHLLPARGSFPSELPPGFPPPPVPADNPISAEKVALGRLLFYDTRLSANGTQSCASCHQQEHAFSDGRSVAIGSTGQQHFRNTMSLTNVAWRTPLTWADRSVESLEQQVLVPLENAHPIELGFAGATAEAIRRLADDEDYRARFATAFPASHTPITLTNMQRALASFERTLISGNSPYDRLIFSGDSTALSEQAWRGMRLFFSERLRCSSCHTGPNLEGTAADAFHNTGLYDVDGHGAYPPTDIGLKQKSSRRRDMGRFRVPTLRNIAVTAPYMHDGSIPTLEAVIDAYAAGGRARIGRQRAARSVDIRPFALSSAEKEDLIAFLHSLTDESFLHDPRFADPRK